MEIRIVNDADGCPNVSVVNPATGETLQSVELGLSQSVTVTAVNAHEASDIQVSEVAATPEPAPSTEGEAGQSPAPGAEDTPPAPEGETSGEGEEPPPGA